MSPLKCGMRLAAFTCPSETWILSDGRRGKNCLLVAEWGIGWEVSSALFVISWRTTSMCFATVASPLSFLIQFARPSASCDKTSWL